jgi:penicillin-binding protein 1B
VTFSWSGLLAWLRARRRLTLLALGAGSLVLLGMIALAVYSTVQLARFARVEAGRSSLVYAAPQPLVAGVHVRLVDLAGTLTRLKYTETRGAPEAPGQYHRAGGAWDIHLRGLTGVSAAQRVRVEVRDERITRVTREGRDIGAAALEPEVLTSAGDRPGEDYRPVRLAEVPLTLVQAVLAAEDHRFFEHAGVDVRGLLRAAWTNVRAGRVRQGGSTITQQLVKNRLLDPKRTLARKVDEAWLASLVEWRYSKEQILEAYVNEVYLGQRGAIAIRGVGAASRAYFRKEIHQLTLPEAALIAGMIRAPNTYSPAANPERARERRDVVLGRLRELGQISPADFEAARRAPLGTQSVVASGQPAPYFTDLVRQELEARYGDGASSSRETRVFTTLDLGLQRLAERAVARGLDRVETHYPRLRRTEEGQRLQAALVALDPTTGRILALVGGRDYLASQFNRAVSAHRQHGSAFKPFVYSAALAPRGSGRGFTAASFLDDSPLTLTVNGAPWSPRNYQDKYLGRVTVREALEQSLNAATVRLAQDVGLPAIIERAHALGLESRLDPVPAMVLGAFEVTPVGLARAFLPFVNGGLRTPPARTVRAVENRRGTLEPGDDEEPQQVLTAAEAYLMTSLLEGVIKSGTGASARALGVQGAIAGKTGTTNEARDAWFVGYAPGILAAVWVGFDGNETHGLSGAEAALPIWAEFMRPALEAGAPRGFTVPSGVTFADIDVTNGRLANRFCPRIAREVFIAGTEPEPCQEHGGVGDHIQDWWNRLRDWWRR